MFRRWRRRNWQSVTITDAIRYPYLDQEITLLLGPKGRVRWVAYTGGLDSKYKHEEKMKRFNDGNYN